MHISTLFFCTVQTAMLIGTIVGWAITAIRIRALVAARPGEGMGSATVFVHVAFCLATLGQVLVLERRVFALRAERWAYKHPGEILPVAHGGRRRGRFGGGSLPIAPWHRPPLPTYASVVADSGARTGDVEVRLHAVIQNSCLTLCRTKSSQRRPRQHTVTRAAAPSCSPASSVKACAPSVRLLSTVNAANGLRMRALVLRANTPERASRI